MNKYILSMLCTIVCVFNTYASENMTWEDKSYSYFHGDFNGDKVEDILLQTASTQTPSLLILGEDIDGSTQFLVKNAIY